MENGGDGPNNEYHWKQTDDEVTITVPLERAYRARELNIVIDSNHLTVGIKGKPPIIDVRRLRWRSGVFLLFLLTRRSWRRVPCSRKSTSR